MNREMYIYSFRLKEFLCNKGYTYFNTGTHRVTGKRFWIFARGEYLDRLLEEYKKS